MALPKRSVVVAKTVLSDTILGLCQDLLPYRKKFSIEGVLGITLDEEEIFLVHINKTVLKAAEPSISSSEKRTTVAPNVEDRKPQTPKSDKKTQGTKSSAVTSSGAENGEECRFIIECDNESGHVDTLFNPKATEQSELAQHSGGVHQGSTCADNDAEYNGMEDDNENYGNSECLIEMENDNSCNQSYSMEVIPGCPAQKELMTSPCGMEGQAVPGEGEECGAQGLPCFDLTIVKQELVDNSYQADSEPSQLSIESMWSLAAPEQQGTAFNMMNTLNTDYGTRQVDDCQGPIMVNVSHSAGQNDRPHIEISSNQNDIYSNNCIHCGKEFSTYWSRVQHQETCSRIIIEKHTSFQPQSTLKMQTRNQYGPDDQEMFSKSRNCGFCGKIFNSHWNKMQHEARHQRLAQRGFMNSTAKPKPKPKLKSEPKPFFEPSMFTPNNPRSQTKKILTPSEIKRTLRRNNILFKRGRPSNEEKEKRRERIRSKEERRLAALELKEKIENDFVFTKKKGQCTAFEKVKKIRLKKQLELLILDLKPYPCCYCQKRFKQAGGLKMHMLNMHAGESRKKIMKKDPIDTKDTIKMNNTEEIYRPGITQHFTMKIEKEESPIMTSVSQFGRKRIHKPSFDNSVQMMELTIPIEKLDVDKYRVKRSHRQKKVECSICHKRLKTAWYLKTHMQKHNQIKPEPGTSKGNKSVSKIKVESSLPEKVESLLPKKAPAQEAVIGIEVLPVITNESPERSAEEVSLPAEEVSLPAEKVSPPAEEVNPTAEEVNPAAEEVSLPAEEVNPPAEEVSPPAEEVHLASEEVNFAAEEVNLAAEKVHPAAEKVNLAAEEVNPTEEEVNLAAKEVNPTAEEVNPAAEKVNLAAEKVHLAAEKVNLAAEEVNLAAEEVNPTAEEVNSAAEEVNPAAQEVNLAAQEDNLAYEGTLVDLEIGSREHQCHLCGKQFSNVLGLVTHQKQKHIVDLLYKCELCECSFITRDNLNTHLSNAHMI